MVKQGYTCARTLVKTYIGVFTCMATKAVHLEVVRDLSSDCFLAALHCFVAHRGCPETLTTDNGTNFIGAQRELKDLSMHPRLGMLWIFSAPSKASNGHIPLLDLHTLEAYGRLQ